MYLAWAIGAALAAVFAAGLGLAILRLRGHYFAIASLVVAEAERWFPDELGLEVFSALIHTHNAASRALFGELGYEMVDVVYVRKLARPGA